MTYLKGVNGDENNGKHIEDDPVVDRADSAAERRESEKLFSAPDLVDSVGILDFFLLDGLFVETRRDFVPVNVTEKLRVVEERHHVRGTHDALEDPVVEGAVLRAVDELDGVTLGPKLAGGGPGNIKQQGDKHDLHEPEVESVDVATLRIHELEAVSERLFAGEAEPDHDKQQVEEKGACHDVLKQAEVEHEIVELVLVLNVETPREAGKHHSQVFASVGGPLLEVEEKKGRVQLGDSHQDDQFFLPEKRDLQVAEAVQLQFIRHHDPLVFVKLLISICIVDEGELLQTLLPLPVVPQQVVAVPTRALAHIFAVVAFLVIAVRLAKFAS